MPEKDDEGDFGNTGNVKNLHFPIRYKFGHSDPCCVYAIFLLAGLSPHSTDFWVKYKYLLY